MAKTPKPSPATPAQPWAKPADNAASGNGGGADAPTAAESNKNETSGAEAVEKAVETAPEGELSAEVKDQLTPSGEHPNKVLETARDAATDKGEPEAGAVINAAEGEVPSEVHDQLTPAGLDISRLFLDDDELTDEERSFREKAAGLSEDEHREIGAELQRYSIELVEKAHRNRVARSMELNLVDGNQHYGKRAVNATAASAEEG